MINCKIRIVLTWSENCVLTSKSARDANYESDPVEYRIGHPVNATFQITDTKLHVSVVTLSTEDNIEQLKSGFKRTIKWNKYRSEMTKQTKTNNLNQLNDPKFNKVNRLFVLSFKNEDYRKYF